MQIRRGATPAEMSERMRELCNINGYDPVYELMELIRSGSKISIKDANGVEYTEMMPLGAKDQVAIHKEMLKYIYPSLKAVDISGTIDANINVTIQTFGNPEIAENMKKAIDADFSDVGEKISENLKKIASKEAVDA